MDLEAGSVVARRYEIKGVVGRGSSSTVYEAYDGELDRQIALKVMISAANDDLRRRLRREAQSAAAVSHSSLVTVYNVGEWRNALFLATEYVIEPTLATLLGELRGSVPASSVWAIGMYCAEALEALHGARIVHRDVKPANVFIVGDLNAPLGIRLADFGLAFQVGQEDTMGRLSDPTALGGTPFYMSPEQASGGVIDESADMYALGCLLYELVAGVPPFMGNVSDVISKHLFAQVVKLESLGLEHEVPPKLSDWIHRMLDKHPDKRPSAKEIVAAFSSDTREQLRGAEKSKARSERSLSKRANKRSYRPVRIADATGGVVPIEGLSVQSWQVGESLEPDILGVVVTRDMLASLNDGMRAQVFVPCDSNHNDIAELVRQGVRGVLEGPDGSQQILRALQRYSRREVSH